MTLDDLIREAAHRGDLRSLTLWTCPDGYQGNVSRDGKSWRVAIDADPAEALRRALGASGMTTDNPEPTDDGIFG